MTLVGSEEPDAQRNGAYFLINAQLQEDQTWSLPLPQAMINLIQMIWQMLVQPILKTLRPALCFHQRKAVELPIEN